MHFGESFFIVAFYDLQRIKDHSLLQKIVLDGNIETRYNDFLNSMKDKVIFTRPFL